MTAPDGFEGELRMMALVRGVISRATISAVTRVEPALSLRRFSGAVATSAIRM